MKQYLIETDHLTKQYGEQKSVSDLSIHVKEGRIYGLLGRNGAGKTTTMKMLLGLTKPTSGQIRIFGKSVSGNEKKILPRIGSLIEAPGFYPNLTGTENLGIFAALRGIPDRNAIRDALDLVGLPYKDKKLFSQYSLGMKQRLAIARALVKNAPINVFDDSFSALDFKTDARLRTALKEETGNSTQFLVAQRISTIMNADQIIVLDHGRVVGKGTHRELMKGCTVYREIALSQLSEEELQ